MADMPIIEREGEGYRIHPQGPLPRSWLNAGTMTGISVAATALLAVTLGGATGGLFPLAGLVGGAVSLGAVAVGGLVGNVMFQRSQDRAEREGVEIQDPGFFNRGMFAGVMQGFGKAGWISLGATLVGLAAGSMGLFGTGAADAIRMAMQFVAWPALAIGGVLAVTGGIGGAREYRQNVRQQVENIENGIVYREAALARGQQPDLDSARAAAVGNSLGVAAVNSPTMAAKAGLISGVGFNGNLQSQGPQFTDYAYNGPEHAHPAFGRDPNNSFAERVRPGRQQVPSVAVNQASSPEAQGFAARVDSLREQLAQAEGPAVRPS